MDNNLGNKETFARNLKRLMEQNDISRIQLCGALGLKYTTLTDWLNAKTYPRIDAIQLLANYFKVSKADLVEELNPQQEVFFISELEKSIIRAWRKASEKDRAIIVYALGILELYQNSLKDNSDIN